MLYPISIKINEKNIGQKIKETLQKLKVGIKKNIKYILFDRKNLKKRILVKLHI